MTETATNEETISTDAPAAPVAETPVAATEDTQGTQGDTKEAVGTKEADAKESTLLDSDAKKEEDKEAEAPKKSDDLLGDLEQQEGQEKAPDEYEPFTLADGKEMDAEDAKAIAEVAKEHNLSQEAAQKAALVANDLMDKMVEQHQAEVNKVMEENAAAWKQQDPTGERTMLARKAVQKMGEEVHAHLKENGYLNDARIMSMLADYGQLISEGKSISGKPAQTQSLLYPNTPELHNS